MQTKRPSLPCQPTGSNQERSAKELRKHAKFNYRATDKPFHDARLYFVIQQSEIFTSSSVFFSHDYAEILC